MTGQGNTVAARRRAALPCALFLALCTALAACGDLPRPFQPAEKSTQAWSAPGDIAWGSILVPPIAGLPEPHSAALADEVVNALQAREVPASAHTGGQGSIVLAGHVSAVTRKLRWTLVTPDGETALRFEEPLLDAARIADSAPDLAAIAVRAARRITAALEPPEIKVAVARSAAPVVLEGVRGAPGDGGIALARAMRHSLARIGIAVADEKDAGTRLISGRVSVLQDRPETDDAAVTIAWDVLRPDGTRLGTVSQSNRVSLEQVTGAWDALAPLVARAGAPGIAQLLAQTETPRFARGASAQDARGAADPYAGRSVILASSTANRGLAPAGDRETHRCAHRARGRSAACAPRADDRSARCAARSSRRRAAAHTALQAAARTAGQAPSRGTDRGLDHGLRHGSVTPFTGQDRIDTVRPPSGPETRPGWPHPVAYSKEPSSMKLVAGNSNRPLAEAIASALGTALTRTSIRRFADSEIFVEILDNVRGEDVFLIQSTSTPTNDNLMELLVCLDALKRASAQRVTAVMPYFGYARQDRKSAPRTPISAKLVANLIQASGANRILTLDLHAGQIQGFFDIPVDNLYAVPVMSEDIRLNHNNDTLMFVSPDVGGVLRARAMAKRFNADLSIVDKRREQAGQSEVMNIIGDVEGRRCVIVDDIVDSAGTLCNAAAALREAGATAVHAYVSHAVLSGDAAERVSSSALESLVVTDSIQTTDAVEKAENIRVLTIAPLMAESILRISSETSVSSLFD